MSDLHHLPPEVIARAFEVGVLAWGIRFLPPVCLVCRDWNDIVAATPCLWSSVMILRTSQHKYLERQIDKSKSANLTVHVEPKASPVITDGVLLKLAKLAANWYSADLATSQLAQIPWSTLRWNLRELTLAPTAGEDAESLADAFFNNVEVVTKVPPTLRKFVANRIPTQWITPFLTVSITHFEVTLAQGDGTDGVLHALLGFLSLIPSVKTLVMDVPPTEPQSALPSIYLPCLRFLQITTHTPDTFLYHIRAPNLETLHVDGAGHAYKPRRTTNPFFTSWIEPNYIPRKLRTLILEDCISQSDVDPFLRWLGHLHALTRFSLIENDLADATFSGLYVTKLVSALSYHDTGWSCPSLSYLRLETDLCLQDLLTIVLSRKAPLVIPSNGFPRPSPLRFVEALLCPCGTQAEVDELRGAVDRVQCSCLGCCFQLTT